MTASEYEWHARIISRHRITIPDFIIRQWELEEGDILQVTVRRPVRQTRDVII